MSTLVKHVVDILRNGELSNPINVRTEHQIFGEILNDKLGQSRTMEIYTNEIAKEAQERITVHVVSIRRPSFCLSLKIFSTFLKLGLRLS